MAPVNFTCNPTICFVHLGGDEYGSGGRRFMADLLVTSLMADGGLEAALEASLLGTYLLS